MYIQWHNDEKQKNNHQTNTVTLKQNLEFVIMEA